MGSNLVCLHQSGNSYKLEIHNFLSSITILCRYFILVSKFTLLRLNLIEEALLRAAFFKFSHFNFSCPIFRGQLEIDALNASVILTQAASFKLLLVALVALLIIILSSTTRSISKTTSSRVNGVPFV